MREINYDRTALEFQNEFIYESIRRDTAERANVLRRVRQNVGINDMRVDSLRRVYNLLDTHAEISRESMAVVSQDINTAERVLSDGTNELAVILSNVQGRVFELQNITDQRASANATLEEMRQTTTAIKSEFERLSGMMSESTDMIEHARSELTDALSDLEQSATDKSLLEKQRDELTIEIDRRKQQATTLLDRLNVERRTVATVKQELREAESEIFLQQTDEMATIGEMHFKHDKETMSLIMERNELIASIRQKDENIYEQKQTIKLLMRKVQHQDATKERESDTLSHISSILYGRHVLQLGDIDKITDLIKKDKETITRRGVAFQNIQEDLEKQAQQIEEAVKRRSDLLEEFDDTQKKGQEMETQIESTRKRLAISTGLVEKYKVDIKTYQRAKTEQQSRLDKLKQEQETCKKELSAKTTELTVKTRELVSMSGETASTRLQLQQEVTRMMGLNASITEQIEKIGADISKTTNTIGTLIKNSESRAEQSARAMESISEYEIEIARSSSILEAKKKEQIAIDAALDNIRQTYITRERDLANVLFSVGDKQYTLEQVNRLIDSKQIEIDKVSVEADVLDRKHKELLAHGAERQSIIDQAKIQFEQKKNMLTQLKLQMEQRQTQIQRLRADATDIEYSEDEIKQSTVSLARLIESTHTDLHKLNRQEQIMQRELSSLKQRHDKAKREKDVRSGELSALRRISGDADELSQRTHDDIICQQDKIENLTNDIRQLHLQKETLVTKLQT